MSIPAGSHVDVALSRLNALYSETAALLDVIDAEGDAVPTTVAEAADEAREVVDDPDHRAATQNPSVLRARVNALDSALGWLLTCIDRAGDTVPCEVTEAAGEARLVLTADDSEED